MEVQLTLIERFITQPAPQNGLHISFIHFQIRPQQMEIMKGNTYMKVRQIRQQHLSAVDTSFWNSRSGGTFSKCQASRTFFVRAQNSLSGGTFCKCQECFNFKNP